MSGLNILTSAVAHVIMPSDLDSRNRVLVHARLIDQVLAQVNLMHPFLPTCSVYKTQCHPELYPAPPCCLFFPARKSIFLSHLISLNSRNNALKSYYSSTLALRFHWSPPWYARNVLADLFILSESYRYWRCDIALGTVHTHGLP